MRFSLSRWRAGHLLLAWVAYWLVLLAVALAPAVPTLVRALSAPQGHGKIDVSADGASFTTTIVTDTATFVGTTSGASLLFWFAVPPLVLWLVWLITRRAPMSQPDSERDYVVPRP